jgi:hypothetical protein
VQTCKPACIGDKSHEIDRAVTSRLHGPKGARNSTAIGICTFAQSIPGFLEGEGRRDGTSGLTCAWRHWVPVLWS